MKIENIIAVLETAKRSEKLLHELTGRVERLEDNLPRIAPKKEMTLVEGLRAAANLKMTNFDTVRATCLDAADRIEMLEQLPGLDKVTTDELLAEIARRVK